MMSINPIFGRMAGRKLRLLEGWQYDLVEKFGFA